MCRGGSSLYMRTPAGADPRVGIPLAFHSSRVAPRLRHFLPQKTGWSAEGCASMLSPCLYWLLIQGVSIINSPFMHKRRWIDSAFLLEKGIFHRNMADSLYVLYCSFVCAAFPFCRWDNIYELYMYMTCQSRVTRGHAFLWSFLGISGFLFYSCHLVRGRERLLFLCMPFVFDVRMGLYMKGLLVTRRWIPWYYNWVLYCCGSIPCYDCQVGIPYDIEFPDYWFLMNGLLSNACFCTAQSDRWQYLPGHEKLTSS